MSSSCFFDQVRLVGFRNYVNVAVELDAGPVVLFGPNGAGKTNFLEALSLFSPGRGLRKASARAIVGDADPVRGWAVSARLDRGGIHHQLGTGFDPAGAGGGNKAERRRLRIDGETQRGQAILPSYLSMVWLTPRMDGIFLDAASERRGFLDQLTMALDPAHAEELAAYATSMRNRAKLLKTAREKGQRADSPQVNQLWLDSVEGSMARHGVAVAAGRRRYVQRLTPHFVDGVPPFPGGQISIEGWLENGLGSQKALELEDAFREALARTRFDDQAAGRCSVGPHRSDLAIRHDGHGREAADCSTGEQKALLLALLLAHARLITEQRAAPPILLLDEVAAHFDPDKRRALFEGLRALGCQVVMTGTHRDPFEGLAGHAQLLEVQDGEIRPL